MRSSYIYLNSTRRDKRDIIYRKNVSINIFFLISESYKNTTASNEKTKSFGTKRENPEESVKLIQGNTMNKDQRL